MQIRAIELKHFRCFDTVSYKIEEPYVLLQGPNGSGKSSVLEALYYAGYLRSCRTYIPKELIQFGNQSFYIKLTIDQDTHEQNELFVGVSAQKRIVKIDQHKITSYKQLFDYYRVISIAEDELMLIKGSPELRRSFIDSALLLFNPALAKLLSKYRTVLENRNALLRHGKFDELSYTVWSEQLFTLSQTLWTERQTLLAKLTQHTNTLIEQFLGNNYRIAFIYNQRHPIELHSSYSHFKEAYPKLREHEYYQKRSLFGAHLDDITIQFDDKHSRTYASRGQQKLIVVLLKVAQMLELQAHKRQAVFLLDDFMTDFDETTAAALIPLLKGLNTQLFFTTPTENSSLKKLLGPSVQALRLPA